MRTKGAQPISVAVVLVMAITVSAGTAAAAQDILGRWDLTIGNPPGTYPSWLEVTRKDGILAARFVGEFGSVRPIPAIEFTGGSLRFSLPPQYERMKTDLSFEGRLVDARIGGTCRGEHGVLPFTGVRAPALQKPKAAGWANPITLFNGKDTNGWRPKDPKAPFGWKIVDGVLENFMPSGDILTDQQFADFKLHIEVKIAPGSNSGIYLRGRYEVQVEDGYGKPPESHRMGGVYGFIDPTENAARRADEWQTYDITLLGRYVTVVLNGRTIIDDKEIPGITGGALHSREGEPGPLMLQGDHGRVSYRNIVLTPAGK